MASWNNKTYESLVAEFPALESKSESVAFTVHAMRSQPDIDAAELRAAGESYDLKIAGRAIGSAREILGLKPATKSKRKVRGAKRGPKKTSAAAPVARRTSSGSSIDSLADVVKALDSLKGMERQNQRMRATLEKIRDVVEAALGD